MLVLHQRLPGAVCPTWPPHSAGHGWAQSLVGGQKGRWRNPELLEQDAAIKETFECQDMNIGGYSNEK